jgi:hypothetical protein
MTTAPTTKFCAERIDGPGGLHLFVDGNQKITAGNGTYDEPKPNAFSIVQVADCPFRTPSCEAACYVHGIEEHAKSTHDLYKHNSKTIRRIIGDDWFDSQLAIEWSYTLGTWIAANAAGGFRWHVSGDIFSENYADWIANVVGWSGKFAPQWIYTRSFPFLEPLLEVSTTRGGNLAINLSADRDNYWLARRYANEHNLRVCYMTTDGAVPDDLRDGDVIFPDYGLRGAGSGLSPHEIREGSTWWRGLTPQQKQATCPVDFYGKSEQNRCGPCNKCIK